MTIAAARDALLAEARDRAAVLLAEAEADTAARLAEARREAEEIVASARARGEAEGRAQAAREAAVEHAQVRAAVLAARREALDVLRVRAHEAVMGLRENPGYDDLLDRLTAQARRDLGDDAVVERDPPDVGGVRARCGTRSIDSTLPVLADRCVEALGGRVRSLWT